MKKLIVLLFAILTLGVAGQENTLQEFGLSVGTLTTMNYLDKTEDVLFGGIPGAGDSLSYSSFESPSITATYKLTALENLMFRVDISWQSISEDVLVGNVKVGDKSTNFLSFGLGADYYYFTRGKLDVYSGFTVAPTLQYVSVRNVEDLDDLEATDAFFNYQINGLGVRYGENLAVTLELGYGYKGVGAFGVAYRY